MSVDDRTHLRWKLAGLIASLVIVLTVPAYVVREKLAGPAWEPMSPTATTFVGGDKPPGLSPTPG